MSQNLLEQLKEFTSVVADTGDLQAIKKFAPKDATTNPSPITATAQMRAYREIVAETLLKVKKDPGTKATDAKILSQVYGGLAISFPRLSHYTEGTIQHSRNLVNKFLNEGVSPKRVMIKIASTWEGICSAKVLE